MLRRLGAVASRPDVLLLWLALTIVVGGILRFSGLDWDSGQHLHPDERFLTMVETALTWPSSLAEYLDSARNPLSPYNHEYGFFVYGTLPLYLVKWVGIALDRLGYDQINLVGRALSGLFDLGSVFLLFLVGRRLYGTRVGLIGAALLSLSVLNIQQAHFFTVDTFASFFALATFYFAVRASENGHWWDYALLGLALGAAVASKLSLFTVGLVAVVAAGMHVYRSYSRRGANLYVILEHDAVRLLLAAVLAVLLFRVAQPISFEGPSILNFTPNEQWLANMREIGDMVSGERDMPPSHQWTDRAALWFPWQNMVLWGMGLPLGLAAWTGWGLAVYELLRRRRLNHLLPLVHVTFVFLYQGIQFVKTMRYFLPIYPLLALFAAYLLVRVWDWAGQRDKAWGRALQPPSTPPESDSSQTEQRARQQPGLRSRFGARGLAGLLAAVILIGTPLYAFAFTSIYSRPHSRVEASRWMYANIPKGSVLANEHWDDALPLRLDGKDGFGGWFRGIEIPNYNEDTPEKLDLLVERLTEADYVVLSSNRLYDSIPRLPMRYPMTTRYYELLFAERLGFAKVAEFTSYPQLLGIALPDQGAEEAFSVYDHPKVTIFQKTESFDREQVRHLLGDGIDWDSILRVRPIVASEARNGLNLSSAEMSVQQAGGTWSEIYDRDGLANRLPVLAWALALALLGLLAAPLAFVALGGLIDRGYAASKALGLLVVGWGAWMLASGHLVPFGPGALGLALGVLLLLSGLVVWARRTAIIAFLRERWRLLLVEEVLFWGLFLLFVWVRAANPDLWHPAMGGEKPMDLAFLNAVAKSTYFPPYDPWFAGGYINYYYFGFVLVASLVRLTGIMPHVAYNLAVPTFFAFTAMGAFAVALNLAEGWRQPRRGGSRATSGKRVASPGRLVPVGLAGALFVAVLGNLGEFQLVLNGLRELANLKFQSTIPGLVGLVSALDGARHLLSGESFQFRPEWWYWNASRMIPHPPNEAGAINEFPFFTFLFADLHAHMMALPYTLVALAFAVSLVRAGAKRAQVVVPGQGEAARPPSSGPAALGGERLAQPTPVKGAIWRLLPGGTISELAALLLPALVIGALWAMNAWDFPTYAVLFAAALACREYWRRGRVDGAAAWGVIWRWAVVLAASFAFFLPFHWSYASAYGSIELWHGSRTPLNAYLLIHGLLLFLVASYLLWELLHGEGHNSVVRLLRVALRWWHRAGRLRRLYGTLARPAVWHDLAMDATLAALLVIAAVLVLRQAVFALAMASLLLTTLLLLSPRPDPRRQFTLCLIGLGFALTLMVEVIVLKGDISRMNTVFKFYFQVWVIWGVASAAALPAMLGRLRTPTRAGANVSHARSTAITPILGGEGPSLRRANAGEQFVGVGAAGWGSLWRLTLGLLLALSLMYPLLATWGRINDRFDKQSGLTLDGMAYMANTTYTDQGATFDLKWDKQAIEWLQDNVEGSPTIVEASTPIYRWGSRVSIYTGLPTVLGWDWHEKQQRAILPGGPVERRADDVRALYAGDNPELARDLLRRYGVTYVYLGPLERAYYPAAGLAKFDRYVGVYWDVAYENEEVTIYKVRE